MPLVMPVGSSQTSSKWDNRFLGVGSESICRFRSRDASLLVQHQSVNTRFGSCLSKLAFKSHPARSLILAAAIMLMAVCWRGVETLALSHHTSLYGSRRHQGDSSALPVWLLTGWTRHDPAGVRVKGRELVYAALSVRDVNTVMNGGAGY